MQVRGISEVNSLLELEEKFKKIFHVEKIIWLKKGLADDYQTFLGKFPGDVFTYNKIMCLFFLCKKCGWNWRSCR